MSESLVAWQTNVENVNIRGPPIILASATMSGISTNRKDLYPDRILNSVQV